MLCAVYRDSVLLISHASRYLRQQKSQKQISVCSYWLDHLGRSRYVTKRWMTSHSPVEPHSRVMLFREVLGRSLCRSMERLVEVEQEYPGGVEYIFSPACVPLWRCAGCCGDENLECHPTLTRNVTMQLMRITPTERTGQYVELTFVEHQTCECRHRKMHLNESSPRVRIHPRRRKHRKRSKDCGKCQNPHS
ncbi:vascular endothelial growth factor A-like isoform X1 [Salmo trutta]|uniref:Vascular endothelial growth factor A-like n=1 Tax=Salmo trutta TaxID=8032 RepID=A0A674AIG6_SALTR|nr:vascular endothelial growth factor A-like isoform X1 [Salmo trutta]